MLANNNEEGAIARLKKRLYRRGEEFGERTGDPELREYIPHSQESWPVEVPEEEIEEALSAGSAKSRSRVLLIVLGAVLFLAISGAAAVWYLLGGFGGISPSDISLTIEGPAELAGGDLAEWRVFIENRSDKALESTDLVFNYPDGSRPLGGENKTANTLRVRKNLGRIAPKARVEERFRAFLFGDKDAFVEAAASLEYRFEGSNVILARDKKISTKITRSPVVVSIAAPQALNSGDSFEVKVEFVSEAKDILADSMLEMEYPDNFEFDKASPRPTEGSTRWLLGDIKPGERRTITITGALHSQEYAEETFRAFLGTFEGANRMIFGSDSATVSLARQFLDLSFQAVNQVIKTGQNVNVKVLWKNNLPVAVENAVLKIVLTGLGYDPKTLIGDSGSFVTADNAMRWSPASYPPFAFVEPGEEGVLNLNFSVPRFFEIKSSDDSNFGLRLAGEFGVPVNPLGFGGVDVAGKRTLDMKVETDIQFLREGFYHFPALPGSGPLPPKVGRETVYTVVWSLVNSTNDVKNVAVSATLPQYMIWKGAVRPDEAKITYDNLTGKIEWKPDLLRAGSGVIRPAEEVIFQVGLVAAPADIDRSPVIVSEAVVNGIDDWTGSGVRASEPALTTDLRNDPRFKQGDGVVVP